MCFYIMLSNFYLVEFYVEVLMNNIFKNVILRGSLGTGYRTPTPYELYSSYGNTNLTPEQSITYDLGSEISFNQNSTVFIKIQAFNFNKFRWMGFK